MAATKTEAPPPAVTTEPAVAEELAELREKVAELEATTEKKEPTWEEHCEAIAASTPTPKSPLENLIETEKIRYERLRADWLSKCGIDPDAEDIDQSLQLTVLSFRGCRSQAFWDEFVRLAAELAGGDLPADGKCDLRLLAEYWPKLTPELRARLLALSIAVNGSRYIHPLAALKEDGYLG